MLKQCRSVWRVPVLITTLASFLLTSCVVRHGVWEMAQPTAQDEKLRVRGVQKTDGETVHFEESRPAWIADGVLYVSDDKVGPGAESVLKRDPNGPRLLKYPLADVARVEAERVDSAGTFFASIGVVAGVLAVGALIVAVTKESCPFVYSYDGSEYLFDAEPYGGAISAGLARTDWARLDHLREVDGRYRLRLANMVNETQYTDELKLVVVDHAPGTAVVPDLDGRFHVFSATVPLRRARDGTGTDVTSLLARHDNVLWERGVAGLSPARPDQLRDDLKIEFPRPLDAHRARLRVTGGSTLWASQMLRRLLELWGDRVDQWYAEVDAGGPARARTLGWVEREEMYRLKVRVETGGGLVERASLLGGGPFVLEERSYELDLTGVVGDTLQLRLTPPVGFWVMDAISVDYAPDEVVAVRELAALRADDSRYGDVRPLLAASDGRWLDMPSIGDRAEIEFKAPPVSREKQRTLFLKASGWYDIHLDRQGPAQIETLTRLREPGQTLRFALEERLNWERELVARLASRQ